MSLQQQSGLHHTQVKKLSKSFHRRATKQRMQRTYLGRNSTTSPGRVSRKRVSIFVDGMRLATKTSFLEKGAVCEPTRSKAARKKRVREAKHKTEEAGVFLELT